MSEINHGRLVDAGFTPDELQAIATDLIFAATMAVESGRDISIAGGGDIHWTPEKRAAWNEVLGEFIGRMRHPDD